MSDIDLIHGHEVRVRLQIHIQLHNLGEIRTGSFEYCGDVLECLSLLELGKGCRGRGETLPVWAVMPPSTRAHVSLSRPILPETKTWVSKSAWRLRGFPREVCVSCPLFLYVWGLKPYIETINDLSETYHSIRLDGLREDWQRLRGIGCLDFSNPTHCEPWFTKSLSLFEIWDLVKDLVEAIDKPQRALYILCSWCLLTCSRLNRKVEHQSLRTIFIV